MIDLSGFKAVNMDVRARHDLQNGRVNFSEVVTIEEAAYSLDHGRTSYEIRPFTGKVLGVKIMHDVSFLLFRPAKIHINLHELSLEGKKPLQL
jgi:hypothetical protein